MIATAATIATIAASTWTNTWTYFAPCADGDLIRVGVYSSSAALAERIQIDLEEAPPEWGALQRAAFQRILGTGVGA